MSKKIPVYPKHKRKRNFLISIFMTEKEVKLFTDIQKDLKHKSRADTINFLIQHYQRKWEFHGY